MSKRVTLKDLKRAGQSLIVPSKNLNASIRKWERAKVTMGSTWRPVWDEELQGARNILQVAHATSGILLQRTDDAIASDLPETVKANYVEMAERLRVLMNCTVRAYRTKGRTGGFGSIHDYMVINELL